MKTEDQNKNISDTLNPQKEQPKPVVETKSKSKKDSKINRALRSAGFAFLFFLLGALVVGLILYLPTNSKLQSAQTELERLGPIEEDYNQLLTDYSQTNSQRLVYKILSNTSLLQVALAENDSSRIDQYIRYIEGDLSDLTLIDFPDIPNALADQFAKITQSVSLNKQKALDELQDFQSDLLLLIDNIE